MKISNAWLREYVDHGHAPEALADLLTMVGLEVDDLETVGETFEGIAVGHVEAVQAHPNADRLSVCQVDLGDGEPVQIVCGAPNVAAGQLVPVATVGAVLSVPDRDDPTQRIPLTIRKSKIRGQVSNGMICAEDELGLGDDHDGILVLDADAVPGQSFAEYLRRTGRATMDEVFDIAITPNRPDATSHIGVARDVAALTNQDLQIPEVELQDTGGAVTEQARIEIEAPDACARYVGLLIRDVEIKPSPEWLQQRLLAVGLRPRNNVVDVTNYVMYTCGQPLHAFDFDLLSEGTIIVRKTDGPSTFTTLDDKERTLPEGTLMICDADGPVAIAGVMGGENSEVSDTTVNVLLESAYFDPSTIRRTAKTLGLQTDASYRFERGVDPYGQAWAAQYAADLIVELAGGTQVSGMIDVHPSRTPVRRITLRAKRVERILGLSIPVEEMARLLSAIGFSVTRTSPVGLDASGLNFDPIAVGRSAAGVTEETLTCTVPTFRPDIEREIDVIEEVARLYGYDAIPVPAQTTIPYAPPRRDPVETLRDRTRMLLSGRGFRETYTNSLLSHELALRFSAAPPVETVNAISQEMNTLRPSLLPGLLRVTAHNQNHGFEQLRFMEFGHVFARTEGPGTVIPGYLEQEHLILILSGQTQTQSWATPARSADVFDVKTEVEHLLASLRLDRVRFTLEDDTEWATGGLRVKASGKRIGTLARVRDDAAALFDLRAPVFYAELDWETMVAVAAARMKPSYQPISRFPSVERDLALVLSADEPAGEVLETIQQTGGRLLQEVRLFDIYEGEPIAAGQKSLAFALRFGTNRTLVDREVDKQMDRIVKRLAKIHGAVLRG